MFLTKQITLADTQRALLFKNKQFQGILESGTHRLWGLNKEIDVETYDMTDAKGIHIDEKLQLLMQWKPEKFANHLEQVTTKEGEIALIYHGNALQHIVPESSHIAFWKALPDLKIERLDVATQSLLPKQVDKIMRTSNALDHTKTYTKDITLGVDKRALLFRDDQLVDVLGSGHYRFWDQARRLALEVIHIDDPLSIGSSSRLLQLAEQHPELFSEHTTRWKITDNEVGLIYSDKVLRDIMSPGSQGMYWDINKEITIKTVTLDDTDVQNIDPALAKKLRLPRDPLLQMAVEESVCSAEIAEKHIGFLLFDGKLQQTLTAGTYSWWKFNRKISVKTFDLRLQNMEVNGQEILTKDRVSLRINLSATWQIVDAEKVMQELTDHKDYLYRELQLALRAVVSTKTLDELLEDKNLLNQDVLTTVAEKAAEFGLDLKTTGVKDIILPGEMKDILAQVVEAEKIAEANLIRRREETQATRSLHNTAKVMQGNPTLLRLKELETLERITQDIDTLNVYGGLDGVMNDMVRLTDKTASS